MKQARIQLKFLTIPIAVLLLFSSSGLFAQYSTTGPLSGSIFSDDNSTGNFSFSSPGNANTSDNSRSSASALLTLFIGNTHYLRATGFGLSIPPLSTITGIKVEVEKSATGINIFASVKDNEIRLLKDGTIVGDNKADNTSWTTNDNYESYGDTTDAWGTTWTPDEINDDDFGVAVSAKINGLVSLLPSARIDHIRVTVFYITSLPIHFINFAVDTKKKNEALLTWTTADNDEKVLFTIQRSTDGSTWTDLASIPGVLSYGTRKYNYTDHITSNHDHFYYRVKMVLLSGTALYTRIAFVNNRQQELFKLFPNPAKDHLNIICAENERINIFSINGKKMNLKIEKLSNTEVRINTSFLRPGLFVIKIGTRQQQLLIQ